MHNPCLAQLMRSDMISSESNTAGSHVFYRNKPHHHGILWGTGCDFRGEKSIFSFIDIEKNEIYCTYQISSIKIFTYVKIKPTEISRKRLITNKCRILFFYKFTNCIFHCLPFIFVLFLLQL